jgi:16S rRNA (guanine527-N7)-methyltransferase
MADEPSESADQQLPEWLEVWQQTLSWQPNLTQQIQFQQLYEQVLEGNRFLNLTRITAPEEFWEKHLWDSLRGVKGQLRIVSGGDTAGLSERATNQQAALQDLSKNALSQRVIDIGTGAGFPGLPVAIARPDWTVTLLDSTRKKITFIDTVVSALDIRNVKTVVERVEQLGHHPQYRESYDLALVRAVAEASVCAEYALPLLRTGGTAVLYRGQWSELETDALAAVVQQMGGAIEQIDQFVTPVSQSVRTCISIQKTHPSPIAFPRPVGVPTQKPL